MCSGNRFYLNVEQSENRTGEEVNALFDFKFKFLCLIRVSLTQLNASLLKSIFGREK